MSKEDIKKVNASKAMREAMEDCGMKQMDIAQSLGVNQSTISGHLNRPRVGVDVLINMMDVMGYDILIGKTEDGEFKPQWKLVEKD